MLLNLFFLFAYDMLEQGIDFLSTVEPFWIYAAIFLVAYVENLFPPSPSDVLVVFGGALSVLGRAHYLGALSAAVLGSTLGFLTMYGIGYWFGERILASGKLKFIPIDALHSVEQWVRKWGYWIIVANRFLAGTRAVVSFFAGLSELNLGRTALLSFVSAAAWNSILVSAGYILGKNWRMIQWYLSAYSSVVTALIVVVLIIVVLRVLQRQASKRKGNPGA